MIFRQAVLRRVFSMEEMVLGLSVGLSVNSSGQTDSNNVSFSINKTTQICVIFQLL